MVFFLLAITRAEASGGSDRVSEPDKELAAPFGVPSRIMQSDWVNLRMPVPNRSQPVVIGGAATIYYFPECELTIIRAKDGSLELVGAKIRNGLTEEIVQQLKRVSGCTDEPDGMTMLPAPNRQQFFAIRKRLLQ